MPTSVGPNTKGEENLVFGYDLGDTSNSYKGEPVTNLQTVDEGNVYQSMGGTGTTRELVDFVTPFGNKAWKVTIPANGTNGYSNTRAQGPTIQINRDGTYYYHGAWVWMSDDDYVLWEQGNTYVYKYSTGSNGMSSWSLRSALNRKDRAGRIWKAWGAWTARTEGGTGNQYHTFYKNGTLTRDLVFYIVAPMWGVGKARPVFFANGTRSATQGLIDLTGNSTIDLTNVSFDSNAQITFDGTDDRVAISPRRQFAITDQWTTELVFKPTDGADTSWNGLFGGALGQGGYWMFHSSGNLTYYEGSSAETGTKITYRTWTKANTFTTGNFHHLTIVYTPLSSTQGSFTLYYNGGEKVETFTWTFSWSYSLDMQNIGAGDGRYGTNDVHYFKQYNRALTASEIKANYNAIKGRFNI